MGFIVDPARKAHAQERLQAIMSETKRRLQRALPFAMEPWSTISRSTNAAPSPHCWMRNPA
jgi:hypothetical protein